MYKYKLKLACFVKVPRHDSFLYKCANKLRRDSQQQTALNLLPNYINIHMYIIYKTQTLMLTFFPTQKIYIRKPFENTRGDEM